MILNATIVNGQDAQPRTVIALWKANLEEPKTNQSDPTVTILENHTSNCLMLEKLLLFFLATDLGVDVSQIFLFWFVL